MASQRTSQPSEDDETVEWFAIQDSLKDAKVEILLLLDCCFSALAARGQERKQSRIELLAAAAMREKTLVPGPRSFTRKMMEMMKECLDTENSVNISSLAAKLASKRANLYTTPIHFLLQRGVMSHSINLEPIAEHRESGAKDVPAGTTVKILIKATAQFNIDEIVGWLRSDLPKAVSTLRVETLIRSAKTIRAFMAGAEEKETPLVRCIDVADLDDITAAWVVVQDTFETYKSQREYMQGASESMTLLQRCTQRFLERLENQIPEVVDVVEQRVLESPSLSDDATMSAVMDDPLTRDLGIKDQLSLRRKTHSSTSQIDHPSDFAPGRMASEKDVLREFKVYGRYINPADIPEVQRRVGLLADLLNASKSAAFRSLQCLGWRHQPFEDRFMLEFEIPQSYRKQDDGVYQIYDMPTVIADIQGSMRPTLGQRFHIAFSIAKAIQKWHTVGWVHQSISGPNVIIFVKESGELDYSMPFLRGFDFARPNLGPSIGLAVDDPAFNVYRHPDRQGPARQGHRKIHDLYSLGVVLLEIGLWEYACRTAGVKRIPNLTVSQMQRNLVKAAEVRLSHHVGADYQEAVLACLQTDFGIELDDRAESRLSRAFEERVLKKLAKCSKIR